MRVLPDRLTPDDDRPLQEVTCSRCRTPVLVRKATPTQTSIQWLTDAGSVCAELAAQRAAGHQTARVEGCAALRASIEQAVHDGRLEILDPDEPDEPDVGR